MMTEVRVVRDDDENDIGPGFRIVRSRPDERAEKTGKYLTEIRAENAALSIALKEVAARKNPVLYQGPTGAFVISEGTYPQRDA